MVQLHDILQCGRQLVLHAAVYQRLYLVLLLQHFIGVVVQHLFRHVNHTVLSKLNLRDILGRSNQVFFLNLDTVSLHQLLLNQVPSQLFNALIVVVLNKLLVLIRIVQTHNALQQCIGEFKLAYLISQHLAQVYKELIVAISNKLVSDNFFHLSAEFFFSLYITLTKYLIEDILVQFTFYEAGNFFYLIAEVRLHFSSSLLIDLQQRSQFCRIAIPCSVRIEHQHIIHLSIGEDSLLFVILHIGRHHHSTFYLDTAFLGVSFLIKFCQQTFQQIVLGISLNLFVLSVALSIGFHLIVYHLIGYLDIIIVYLVILANLYFKLRCQSDVKQEFKFFHCIEIDSRLFFFIRQRFAQDVYLIVLNILIYSF